MLTTKLFCGYCREMMTGYGGTGKSGKAYHYHACKNAKKHKCQKKVVDKNRIEKIVYDTCAKLLTDRTSGGSQRLLMRSIRTSRTPLPRSAYGMLSRKRTRP